MQAVFFSEKSREKPNAAPLVSGHCCFGSDRVLVLYFGDDTSDKDQREDDSLYDKDFVEDRLCSYGSSRFSLIVQSMTCVSEVRLKIFFTASDHLSQMAKIERCASSFR